MNLKKYIESGILELYLTGSLSEEEAAEVRANLEKYPKLQEELNAIEITLRKTSTSLSPKLPEDLFDKIESKIDSQNDAIESQNIPEKKGPRLNSWSILLGLTGLVLGIYGLNSTIKGKNTIENLEQEKTEIQNALDSCETKQANQNILFAARSAATKTIILSGQEVSPQSYAVVHWNENDQTIVIDASGLPSPPSGKEYQLWSLIMNPLTPTDAGVLTEFETNESLLFAGKNVNLAEGFAITLEPTGGSLTPSLDQLYVLGTI